MSLRVKLLNIEVDDLSMSELLESFHEGALLTLHSDMLMKLQRDRDFYEILPHFDVVTCDSQILFWASRLLGTPLRERVSGSDYFPLLYQKRKDDPSFSIFLCGGRPGVPEAAARNINAKVGREVVVGTDSPPFGYESSPSVIDDTLAKINDSRASVLLVGLGAGRQEKFIARYRDRLPHVKMFLPLGGTVDYEARTLVRPAPWVTNVGLEWAYRVVREPKQRWRRYLVEQPPVLTLLMKQRLGTYRNPFEDVLPERRVSIP